MNKQAFLQGYMHKEAGFGSLSKRHLAKLVARQHGKKAVGVGAGLGGMKALQSGGAKLSKTIDNVAEGRKKKQEAAVSDKSTESSSAKVQEPSKTEG